MDTNNKSEKQQKKGQNINKTQYMIYISSLSWIIVFRLVSGKVRSTVIERKCARAHKETKEMPRRDFSLAFLSVHAKIKLRCMIIPWSMPSTRRDGRSARFTPGKKGYVIKQKDKKKEGKCKIHKFFQTPRAPQLALDHIKSATVLGWHVDVGYDVSEKSNEKSKKQKIQNSHIGIFF